MFVERNYEMKNTLVKKIAISAIVGSIITFIMFYFALPAINGYDPKFWTFMLFVVFAYAIPYALAGSSLKIVFANSKLKFEKKTGYGQKGKKKKSIPVIIFFSLVGAIVLVLVVGSFISSTILNAKRYANIITINEAVFSEDMKESDEITNIALMDSESARKRGNTTLASLADVVSQFVAGDNYTQINYHGLPKKVTSLEYADFFKWINNSGVGVPGYIMVDPVKNDAEYVKLETPIKYVESGYFSDDLVRKLRFDYPTKIFDFISYEIDEQGTPYYIVSCVKPKIFPFGGYDVNEVIIFDPCTGESTLYPVSEAPAWIDTAFSGDLAMEKYNWHGTLSGGFINSIIGNKGCKITTDDYGYIAIEDDVWYFTGVTSVTSDRSNIGFILTNARTGEYKYYPVGGAEEHTAMEAAQGEVADMGYIASFPSLVNIEGEATYIMVLKDGNGIVKLYALVNVEEYTVGIATGKTQDEVMKAYKARLIEEGIITPEEAPQPETPQNPTAEFTIDIIKNAVISGDSVVYFKSAEGDLYRGVVGKNEMLIWLTVGDKIKVEYTETVINGQTVRDIVSFEKIS